MNVSVEGYRDRLLQWLRTAVDEGWIAGDEIEALESLETQGADRLFDGNGARPLTVGLFGGTGVGKSSLLNRLVGEPVAVVGLERPTSTEVTLYVHRHYAVKHLEELFPIERVKVLEHDREECRDVVWIDMPDIDSVERANRELVFEWLPYIDWLIYVVSPERYRDDVGWQVLKRRAHRHHWLFVMNHWDAGSEAQLVDFNGLLSQEGFGDTRVLATSCGAAPVSDDFARVSETIDEAVAKHGLKELQQVGERARIADLDRQRDRYAAMLGTETQWRDFMKKGSAVMGDKLAEVTAYLRDEAVIEAAHVPDRRSDEGVSGKMYEPPRPGLVTDYVQDLQSVVAMSVGELPAGPVRQRTRDLMQSLDERLVMSFRQGFRAGIARPGSALQRQLVSWMRKLVYGLPLITGAAVAYLVLMRYQQGLRDTGEFLGFDFLSHSLMVLGLSALLPYLAARVLRPSVRRSIVRRVGKELDGLRGEVLREWGEAMGGLFDHSGELRAALEEMGID